VQGEIEADGRGPFEKNCEKSVGRYLFTPRSRKVLAPLSSRGAFPVKMQRTDLYGDVTTCPSDRVQT